ncbi:hypothetical protein M422DRAFT_241718 [Sphaerobolus stellatus SS14]|nr:hypothetical protein M422DRAFT_241718 [Sphaerobolus stellatus SS14]
MLAARTRPVRRTSVPSDNSHSSAESQSVSRLSHTSSNTSWATHNHTVPKATQEPGLVSVQEGVDYNVSQPPGPPLSPKRKFRTLRKPSPSSPPSRQWSLFSRHSHSRSESTRPVINLDDEDAFMARKQPNLAPPPSAFNQRRSIARANPVRSSVSDSGHGYFAIGGGERAVERLRAQINVEPQAGTSRDHQALRNKPLPAPPDSPHSPQESQHAPPPLTRHNTSSNAHASSSEEFAESQFGHFTSEPSIDEFGAPPSLTGHDFSAPAHYYNSYSDLGHTSAAATGYGVWSDAGHGPGSAYWQQTESENRYAYAASEPHLSGGIGVVSGQIYASELTLSPVNQDGPIGISRRFSASQSQVAHTGRKLSWGEKLKRSISGKLGGRNQRDGNGRMESQPEFEMVGERGGAGRDGTEGLRERNTAEEELLTILRTASGVEAEPYPYPHPHAYHSRHPYPSQSQSQYHSSTTDTPTHTPTQSNAQIQARYAQTQTHIPSSISEPGHGPLLPQARPRPRPQSKSQVHLATPFPSTRHSTPSGSNLTLQPGNRFSSASAPGFHTSNASTSNRFSTTSGSTTGSYFHPHSNANDPTNTTPKPSPVKPTNKLRKHARSKSGSNSSTLRPFALSLVSTPSERPDAISVKSSPEYLHTANTTASSVHLHSPSQAQKAKLKKAKRGSKAVVNGNGNSAAGASSSTFTLNPTLPSVFPYPDDVPLPAHLQNPPHHPPYHPHPHQPQSLSPTPTPPLSKTHRSLSTPSRGYFSFGNNSRTKITSPISSDGHSNISSPSSSIVWMKGEREDTSMAVPPVPAIPAEFGGPRSGYANGSKSQPASVSRTSSSMFGLGMGRKNKSRKRVNDVVEQEQEQEQEVYVRPAIPPMRSLSPLEMQFDFGRESMDGVVRRSFSDASKSYSAPDITGLFQPQHAAAAPALPAASSRSSSNTTTTTSANIATPSPSKYKPKSRSLTLNLFSPLTPLSTRTRSKSKSREGSSSTSPLPDEVEADVKKDRALVSSSQRRSLSLLNTNINVDKDGKEGRSITPELKTAPPSAFNVNLNLNLNLDINVSGTKNDNTTVTGTTLPGPNQLLGPGRPSFLRTQSNRRWTLAVSETPEDQLLHELDRLRSIGWGLGFQGELFRRDERMPGVDGINDVGGVNVGEKWRKEEMEEWLGARKALLVCREIVRTEKTYREGLIKLQRGETLKRPPPLLLQYLPALISASEELSARLTEDPSAWGVSVAFIGAEETLEVAFVAWSGVVGEFFGGPVGSRSNSRSRSRLSRSRRASAVGRTPSGSTAEVAASTGGGGAKGGAMAAGWRISMGAVSQLLASSTEASVVRRTRYIATNGGGVTAEKVPSVQDLAIQPTQRVMRYVLLYKDLLNSTPISSPARAPVERALEGATRIAQRCNRAQDNAEFLM